jgi:hypothetical protein
MDQLVGGGCPCATGSVIGAPLSTSIFYLDGFLGIKGWQWVFLSEALPALILSVVTWFYMIETPAQAHGWRRTNATGW